LPVACLTAAALSALLPHPWKRTGLMLAACAWTLAHMAAGLDRRYAGAGEPVTLEGRVVSLPVAREELLEFRLRTLAPVTGLADGSTVLVRWYRPVRRVHAGERWVVQARLKPPRGRVNFAGPDTERTLFATGVAALAAVSGDGGDRQAEAGAGVGLHGWRDRFRERLLTLLAERPGTALVLALAIADRQSLDAEFRRVMAVTGTAHLLAISGLHVGLVALFGYGLGRSLAGPLMARLGWSAIHPLALVLGLAGAAAYAALAGFSTSTRRALIMLCVPLACVLLRRSTTYWRAWLLALTAVLLADPLAPLQAGFWLSFMAVAVLVFLFGPRKRRGGPLAGMLMAQAGIGLCLLPPGLAIFQQASAGGSLANLAAIPWVGFITLPLTLLGTALAFANAGPAEFVLQMAAASADGLSRFLGDAAAWLGPLHWTGAAPNAVLLLCGMLGGTLLLMPWGTGARLLAMAVYLAALVNPERAPRAGGMVLELLDVGQGLAVLVRTREHLLMYDTGPGIPGHWDLDGPVLAPALARHGRLRPDRLVVSHGDLDHAGALATLRTRYGAERILASLPPARSPPPACREGVGWRWDGVRFRVLHPSAHLPYRGNDSSCVIEVRAGGASLLLPGDVGSLVERRLAGLGGEGFNILVAPHHGSRTSTGADLLAWARPQLVLISAGAGNRFGFPHPEVLQRIRRAGAQAWATSACGALRVGVSARGAVESRSARRERSGFWRWPAAEECP